MENRLDLVRKVINNPFIQNILSRPSIGIKDFFLKRSDNLNKNIIFFKNGRDAIVYGIKKLKIKEGCNILIPSYICQSIPSALELNGYKIVYQDINDQLSFDINILKNNITKHQIKAVLFVNYFGFIGNNSEVLDLCRDLDIVSIEDNCHSYLSGDKFYLEEIEADLSIFSLRKSLPVKDGGVLRVNSKHIKKNNNHEINLNHKSLINDLPFLVSKIAEYIISKLGIFNLYSDLITKTKDRIYKHLGNVNKQESNKIKSTRPSFLLNRFLTNQSYEEEVKKKVIKNFDYLMQKINPFFLKPLLINRNEGTVPQYAIFFDSNATIFRNLRRNRIGASRWPANELPDFVRNNKETFPNSNFFNENLVMIPIHKDITKKHLDSIIDIIKH
tara:strand:+ start:30921 stop:32081 length:1161 start_codon:yes stop_codon:yes gene_type:complete